MKKRWILLILPLMMMVMPVASANGWGLPEALVPLVSNTNDYANFNNPIKIKKKKQQKF